MFEKIKISLIDVRILLEHVLFVLSASW